MLLEYLTISHLALSNRKMCARRCPEIKKRHLNMIKLLKNKEIKFQNYLLFEHQKIGHFLLVKKCPILIQ